MSYTQAATSATGINNASNNYNTSPTLSNSSIYSNSSGSPLSAYSTTSSMIPLYPTASASSMYSRNNLNVAKSFGDDFEFLPVTVESKKRFNAFTATSFSPSSKKL